MEIGDVIQKRFRSGYERVETVAGDQVFKRGMFSRGSLGIGMMMMELCRWWYG